MSSHIDRRAREMESHQVSTFVQQIPLCWYRRLYKSNTKILATDYNSNVLLVPIHNSQTQCNRGGLCYICHAVLIILCMITEFLHGINFNAHIRIHSKSSLEAKKPVSCSQEAGDPITEVDVWLKIPFRVVIHLRCFISQVSLYYSLLASPPLAAAYHIGQST
jgi:hypothetical protein